MAIGKARCAPKQVYIWLGRYAITYGTGPPTVKACFKDAVSYDDQLDSMLHTESYHFNASNLKISKNAIKHVQVNA